MVILQHSPSTLGHTMFDSIHSPISDLDDLVQNNERCLEGKMEPVPHKHTDIVVSQARASQTVLRGSGLWDYRYCGWDPAMLWPHLHGCQVYHQLDSFTKHLLTLGHLLTSSRQARETICWNSVHRRKRRRKRRSWKEDGSVAWCLLCAHMELFMSLKITI